jgi:uncharacterized protein YbjT (DUF2867 family)
MSRENVIAVTGATGRVGQLVAERLLSAGHTVRVVARNAEKLKPLAGQGAEVRTGSLFDPAFLTGAFRGTAAAFVLTALDVKAAEVNIDQYKKAASIATAIRDAGVKYVVFLSSWGTDLPDKSGGIIGCRRLEELLDEIPGLNVVHLRPVWFMENFLWNIGLIKMAGINGLAIRPDVSFPMIAARDIAPVASDYLASLNFKGRNVRYLNGPRDYTMTEVTRVLGAAIGRPDLKYVEFPDAIFRKGLIAAGGLSPHAADMAIEINRGIDSRLIKAEPRSKLNTTPTTLEEFARTKFAPTFNAAPNASFSERFGGMFLRSYLVVAGRRAA